MSPVDKRLRPCAGMLLFTLVAWALAPQVSSAAPADSRLLYVSHGEGPDRTWVTAPDGSSQRPFKGSREWWDARWSPDGTRFAFNAGGDIYLASADGDGLIRLTRGSVVESHPQWLPSGKALIYTRRDGLWKINTDGTGAQALALDLGSDQPVLSPDGKKIAWSHWDPDPAKYGLYVARLEQWRAVDPVRVSAGSSQQPRWSPDGTQLAYTRYRADGGDDVFIGQADGTGERLLLSAPEVSYYSPVWSPSGEHIAVSRRPYHEEQSDLYLVNVADGHLELLVGTDAHEGAWDWGPVPQCDRNGSGGDDVIAGTSASETICGGGGNDRIIASGGTDLILGGAGFDRIDFRASEHGVNVDLRKALANGHTVLGVEGVLGTDADDVVFGGDDRNIFNTYGGNDALVGRGGNDTLNAGHGDDVLRPGDGGDDLNGGEGRDSASYFDATRRVRVNLGNSLAFIGDDTDVLIRMEKVIGSAFDDTIIGSDGRDVLKGGDGEDTIEGQSGPDDLYGGDERDFIYGNGGDDDVYGDDGRDYGDGGPGDDECAATEQVVRC